MSLHSRLIAPIGADFSNSLTCMANLDHTPRRHYVVVL